MAKNVQVRFLIGGQGHEEECVQMRHEGKSSVINSAVSQLLRYEHCGNGHEAEVAVLVCQPGPYI